MDFSDFKVREVKSMCPPSAVYIPNFITSEEEKRILSQISRTPKPKWTQLLNRRLINYGGVPHPNGMLAEEIPEWLQVYMGKINNLNFQNIRPKIKFARLGQTKNRKIISKN
nr:alpha-ketoglutarate-dependent dioxygenase alkB homolog 6 isoform X7 [Bactrocera oleae]